MSELEVVSLTNGQFAENCYLVADRQSREAVIIDPGEEPAVSAAREAMEETGVEIRVDRLASVGSGTVVTHPNGDRARYLDLTFACTWLSGEPYVADDESLDARWWPLAELPPMAPVLLERIEAALSGEEAARFRS